MRIIASLLCATVLSGAVRGDHAAYIGGSVASIAIGTQGGFVLDQKAMTFSTATGSIQIPYADVTEMEFGQKVGRRVGLTVALGVTTLGLLALPVLFSKKKKHFLTVSYQEGAVNQVAVFELAKDIVATTLPMLEARTGKKILRQGSDYKRNKSERALVPAATIVPTVTAPAAPTAVAAPLNKSLRMSPMSNQDVMKIVASGLNENLVLTLIANSDPHFNLTPSFTDQLTKAGVSDDLIRAMAARQMGR